MLHNWCRAFAGLLCMVLVSAPVAWAQGQVAPSTALVLQVEAAPQLPSAPVLAAALEAELDIRVSQFPVLGQATALLTVAAAGPNRARVAFALPGRPVVGREVQLPKDPLRAVDTLTLLLANLVHSEAGDLLASLRAAKKAELAAPPVVLEPPPPAPLPPVPVPPPAAAPPPVAATPTEPPAAATPVAVDPNALRRVAIGIDLVPGVTLPRGPVDGTVRRLSFGGITYSTGLDGFEGAVIGTLHRGDVRGAQVASVFHLVGGNLEGLQAASSFNLVAGRLHGAQLASGANLAGEVDRGLQLAVFNGALRQVRGAQIGIANAALGPVAGLQLGLVNLAGGHVHGAQIGLLNLGKSADAGIGLLSLYWDGRTHVQAWTDGARGANVAVEHGSNRLHNVLLVGAQPGDEPGSWLPHAGVGLGLHTQPLGRVSVDFDVLQRVFVEPSTTSWSSDTQLRIVGGLRLFGSVRLIGGPTWTVRVGELGVHVTSVNRGQMSMVRVDFPGSGTQVGMDLGWFAGVSVF